MSTSTVKYAGSLRTECTHHRSGNTLITDAPIDNKGKGEAFSPTDLTATSLAACMLTIMGITANEKGIDLGSPSAEVTKVMYSEPRRIGEIHIEVRMDRAFDEKQRKLLERAALTCPVANSLDPKIDQRIAFRYD